MLFKTVAGLVTAASSAAASALWVNNWCDFDVYVYQSNGGKCDSGPNTICSYDSGASPFLFPAGHGNPSIGPLGWIQNGEGTSVKIFSDRNNYPRGGILQFEYDFADWFYWDGSLIDGNPFGNTNVKFTPTGNRAGGNGCSDVRCPAYQSCPEVYHSPNDPATRTCPVDTGDFYIDLCEPQYFFNQNKKRGLRAGDRA